MIHYQNVFGIFPKVELYLGININFTPWLIYSVNIWKLHAFSYYTFSIELLHIWNIYVTFIQIYKCNIYIKRCFMGFFSTDCLNRTAYATFVNKITPLHIVRNNLKFKVLVIFYVYRVLTLVMPMSKYQVSSMKETDLTLVWHIII